MLELSDERMRTAAALVPKIENSRVAIAAPGDGPGFWTGAPSAVEADGMIYLAYRLRRPVAQGRGQGVVIAKSRDGVKFDSLVMIRKDDMDAESLERPALVRTGDGKWRLYVSCATTGTKHWRVEVLEADDPAKFDATTRRVVLPGDERWAVKDPVIRIAGGVWHLWASCHPLDIRGQEDRMVTNYATSTDGINWKWRGTALDVRPGQWDARGVRVTAVMIEPWQITAFYDGRATAEENFDERTGVAVGAAPGNLSAAGDAPIAESAEVKALRYLDIVPLMNGGHRLYYELARPNGSHELRTELR